MCPSKTSFWRVWNDVKNGWKFTRTRSPGGFRAERDSVQSFSSYPLRQDLTFFTMLYEGKTCYLYGGTLFCEQNMYSKPLKTVTRFCLLIIKSIWVAPSDLRPSLASKNMRHIVSIYCSPSPSFTTQTALQTARSRWFLRPNKFNKCRIMRNSENNAREILEILRIMHARYLRFVEMFHCGDLTGQPPPF